MKEIKLTRNMVALVDDEDFDFLNQWKWQAGKSKESVTYYASRTERGNELQKPVSIKMHRLIMKTPDNMEVDHIDHNGLNNQKSNLRNCTHSQNHMNKRPHGRSKYLGVSWASDRNKWIVYIQRRVKGSPYERIQLYREQFDSEIDAALAYNKKASELFGEFAHLNII